MFCLGGLLSQALPGRPSIVSVQVFLGLVDSTEARCAGHGVCLSSANRIGGCMRTVFAKHGAGRIQNHRKKLQLSACF